MRLSRSKSLQSTGSRVRAWEALTLSHPLPTPLPEEEIHTQNLRCLLENHLEKQRGQPRLKPQASQARPGKSSPAVLLLCIPCSSMLCISLVREPSKFQEGQGTGTCQEDHPGSSSSQPHQESRKGPQVLHGAWEPLAPHLGFLVTGGRFPELGTQPCRAVAASGPDAESASPLSLSPCGLSLSSGNLLPLPRSCAKGTCCLPPQPGSSSRSSGPSCPLSGLTLHASCAPGRPLSHPELSKNTRQDPGPGACHLSSFQGAGLYGNLST